MYRVLQERSFERLDSNTTIRVDVRVVAATNRDLEKAIAHGSLRDDLYHRLNVVTVKVPPLRERPEDIPELIEYFLTRFARELKVDRPPVSREGRTLLESYSWPGNVRELENCIQRVMIFTRGYSIQAADLSPMLRGHGGASSSQAPLVKDGELADLVRRYLGSCRGIRPHEQLLEEVENFSSPKPFGVRKVTRRTRPSCWVCPVPYCTRRSRSTTFAAKAAWPTPRRPISGAGCHGPRTRPAKTRTARWKGWAIPVKTKLHQPLTDGP